MRKIAKQFSASAQSSRGFSLIEVLVSLSLFIVVITMGIGSLLVLINANAKAQNIQSAVGNVQFALDSMAREIRTGQAYYCSNSSATDITGGFVQVNDCVNQGIYLSIIEGGDSLTSGASNNRLAYRYNSVDRTIERKIGSGSWLSLTDPSVSIDHMHFQVIGSATKSQNGSIVQPNVTIYIAGSIAGVSATDADFTLQTTVTKRVLDI